MSCLSSGVKPDFHSAENVARSTFLRSLSFKMCGVKYIRSTWMFVFQNKAIAKSWSCDIFRWMEIRLISLHTIPYFNDDRPEAKRRRKIWVDFVKAKRVFVPSKASTLCSAHFMPEDYERRFSVLPGQTKPNYPKSRATNLVFVCIQVYMLWRKKVLVNRSRKVPEIDAWWVSLPQAFVLDIVRKVSWI